MPLHLSMGCCAHGSTLQLGKWKSRQFIYTWTQGQGHMCVCMSLSLSFCVCLLCAPCARVMSTDVYGLALFHTATHTQANEWAKWVKWMNGSATAMIHKWIWSWKKEQASTVNFNCIQGKEEWTLTTRANEWIDSRMRINAHAEGLGGIPYTAHWTLIHLATAWAGND